MKNLLLVVVVIILYIAWKVFRSYFWPIKKYRHLMERVAAYDKIGNRRKAIVLLEDALGHPQFPLEDSDVGNILLELGERYFKLGEYGQSIKHFDTLFQKFADENFYYTPQFLLAIQAYVRAGEQKRAQEVYHKLLDRQSYDKNFQMLHKVDSLFDPPRS